MLKSIIHWVSAIVKILLLLLLLPFIVIYAALRYFIFKASLASKLRKSGMPPELARELSCEFAPNKFMGRS